MPTNNKSMLSYFALRQLIGAIGLLLPFILVLGSLLLSKNCNIIQPSISHYYYTIMHVVFVGLLCLLGCFLITYNNNWKLENRVSTCAGIFAIGVATFPTNVDGFNGTCCKYLGVTSEDTALIGYIHYGCAAALFVCFAIFCFYIFKSSDTPNSMVLYNTKKPFRNKIYNGCGWVIAISIASIGTIAIIDYKCKTDYAHTYFTTIIFETTALLAFGFAWLLKGSVNWVNSRYALKKNIIKYFR